MPTALLSVFDKTGLIPLAEGLRNQGWTLLATGGTLKGVLQLLESFGVEVASIGVLMELGFLAGREKLAGHRLESLIRVD